MKCDFLTANWSKFVSKTLIATAALLLVAACSSSEGTDESGSADIRVPVNVHQDTSASAVSQTSLTFTWNAVTSATEYAWQLTNESASNVLQSGKTDQTSIVITRLRSGQTYKFRIQTWIGNQHSEWSEYVTATTERNKSDLNKPVAKVESVSETEASFSWTAVENAAKYSYELLTKADGKSFATAETDQTACTINKLTSGVEYVFRVKAIPAADTDYSESPWSGELVITTHARLATPQPQCKSVSSYALEFTWAAIAHATGYGWKLLSADGQTVVHDGTTTDTAIFVGGLTADTEYQFQVQAIPADNGNYLVSEWSSAITARTAQQATTPAGDLGLPLANEGDGVIRAFPGAEGGGMYTTGGRDGEIYYVTNLNDSGAGSLRDALSKGNRTILFKVCGTIKLLKDVEIKYPNITIAGQSAPGDGICVSGGTITVKANNVIIRYMRFRLGDLNEGGNLGDGSDTIWGRYFENIILDHCSMSWSIDEVASFYANKNFTMQWCLLAEALCNSAHGKGSHGYGGIWGGKNASFHHNMLANNNSRNARIDHPYIYGNYLTTHRGNVDYRNNVIYNWGDNSTYGGEDGWFNIVNNYYKPGPASKERKYFVDANSYYSGQNTYCRYPRLYLAGNYHAGSYASNLNGDNWQGIYYHDGKSHTESDVDGMHLTAPLSIKKDDVTTCYTSTHSAEQAFDQVLKYVGASMRRDAVDTRITGDARTGTATYSTGSNGSKGGIIDSQKDVGGWPTLTASEDEIYRATVDTDNDGIPDYYETLLGLDSNNAADAKSKTLDPQGLYSNLEVYLHYLVKDVTAAQVVSSTYTPLN